MVLAFLLTLTTISCQGFLSGALIDPIYAEGGVLDLTGVDISGRGVLTLGGEWEFVYGSHVLPEEATGARWADAVQPIKVPSTWKGYVYQGETLPGIGIATYRLTIRMKANVPERLSLLIPAWETAYRVFINGTEAASTGNPGIGHSDTVPSWRPLVLSFDSSSETLELMFHVSNFEHARGGPAMVPYLGTEEAIRDMREKGIGIKLFSFGSLFMISLYHFVIFLLRRKEKSPLFFSLFCITMAIRSLVVDEQSLVLFAPFTPWHAHVRITYLSLALAITFSTLFVKSLYESEMNKLVSRGLIFAGLFFAAMILLTPPVFFTDFVFPMQVIIALMSLYIAVVLAIASYRNREGAKLFLAAFLIYSLCIINDIFYHQQIISSAYLVPIGSLLFIYLQAIVLSRRYATSFVKIEELSTEKSRLEGTAQSLQSLSYQDPLTGIANRRRLDEWLDLEWRRAIREGNELSFIMVDIDFFKTYNDRFGHPAGDRVLKMVASAIQSCVRRPADLVTRYGGDEFGLLLPGTGIEGTISLSEKIRLKVLGLGIQPANQSVAETVSLSLGCATIKPSLGQDPMDLVKEADQALYQAKTKGKNRTERVDEMGILDPEHPIT